MKQRNQARQRGHGKLGEGVTPESRSLDIEPPWASRAAVLTEREVGSPVKQVSGNKKRAGTQQNPFMDEDFGNKKR